MQGQSQALEPQTRTGAPAGCSLTQVKSVLLLEKNEGMVMKGLLHEGQEVFPSKSFMLKDEHGEYVLLGLGHVYKH